MKDKCFFDLNDHRRLGVVVKQNPRTVWVKFIAGCNTAVYVKRHIRKHHVTFME